MITIALDGPSGAGKSTVCDIVADKLGILHLNTGALYRAVGLYVIKNGIDAHSENDVVQALANINIDIDYDNGVQNVILNGVDVTDELYTMKVSDISSLCSPYAMVRKYITSIQRKIAQKYSIIMEGRDITSEVLPDAKYKFYLDASSDVRARRRINDSKNKDKLTMSDFERIKAEIEERDRRDKTRTISPLIIVPDAKYINSDNISANEVAQIIIDVVKGDVDETNN